MCPATVCKLDLVKKNRAKIQTKSLLVNFDISLTN